MKFFVIHFLSLIFCSGAAFAQAGAASSAATQGNPCKGGGTGKCQKFCSDLRAALGQQCLQDALTKFSNLMHQDAIKNTGGNWCPSESSADPKAVAVALVAGVALGESSCSEDAKGPSAGTHGEYPVGACQLNQSSVQPYPCCGGVTQGQLASNGPVEAKCGMGEILTNVNKDQVWAGGETGKGNAKGAARFNQSCADSKPNLKRLAEDSVRDGCRSGSSSDYLGNSTATQ